MIHDRIAQDVIGGLGQMAVRCTKCARAFPVGTSRFALYLRSGWPECCGLTMSLERREPDEMKREER